MFGLSELNETLKSFRDEVVILNAHLKELKEMIGPVIETANEVDDLKDKVVGRLKEVFK